MDTYPTVKVCGRVQGQSFAVNLDRIPDVCPRCLVAVVPAERAGVVVSRLPVTNPPQDAVWIEVCFQCPRDECGWLVLASYALYLEYGRSRTSYFDQNDDVFRLRATRPRSIALYTAPKRIVDLSPSFKEIADQSRAAEDMNLHQVAGPGYRKALEFLIKDYLIQGVRQKVEAAQKGVGETAANEATEKAEQQVAAIKKESLGDVIHNRVKEANVKVAATRALWIGNDETHYERKWESKDITDLKKLLELTVNWIDMELLTAELTADMPQGKK